MSPSEFGGEFSGEPTVIGITEFADSFRIMEHGEQPNDFDIGPRHRCEPQPVFQHSCPVGNPVIAMPRQCVVRQDDLRGDFL